MPFNLVSGGKLFMLTYTMGSLHLGDGKAEGCWIEMDDAKM